ncbi:MAG: ATP-binding protein [Candidatus Borkfalkiaceae bacterium]|nr:ATP-binding protein [Christensenellaceae bacterium]
MDNFTDELSANNKNVVANLAADEFEITAEELEKLLFTANYAGKCADENAAKNVEIFDIRDESDRAYGFIPQSKGAKIDELLKYPQNSNGLSVIDDNFTAENRQKKQKIIIIYCAKGIYSLNAAIDLRQKGYIAYSLKGGYIEYVRLKMKRQNASEICEKAERSLRKKFKGPLLSKFIKAAKIYKLINEGDKIAVCISGGKDSMLMAKLFQELKRHSEVNFDLEFLVMDPGYNAENRAIIEENAKKLNIPIKIFNSDIFDAVFTVEKSPCYLCARMRRGYLYSFAKSLGCNKIALGHHYDDVIETILMGMLYGAQIQTMMPKLHSTNFEGMELIRPMYLIREDDIKAWRDYNDLSFIRCACKFTDTCTTCNNGENHSKRMEAKELIRQIKQNNPDVEKCIFKSVENVNLDTVIAYKQKGVRHNFLDEYDKKSH